MTLETSSLRLIFSGYIHLEKSKLKPLKISYFEKSCDYFKTKYHQKWLSSIFNNGSNHIDIDKDKIGAGQSYSLVVSANKDIPFKLNSIELLKLYKDAGMFMVKVELTGKNLSVLDITSFIRIFRTLKSSYKFNNLILQKLDKLISSISSKKTWRDYNPHLKSCVYVDVNQNKISEHTDKLLFDLCTLNDDSGLYDFHDLYHKKILNEKTLSIYSNWRTICLNDIFVRVACNLDAHDTLRLWENEYILIYLQVVFSKFYLFDMNNQLLEAKNDIKKGLSLKRQFFDFEYHFLFKSISSKFLPNEIYQYFYGVFGLEEEKVLIEKKIEGLNQRIKQSNDNRFNRVLFFLALTTLFAVSNDATNLINGVDLSSNSGIFSLRLMLFLLGTLIITFLYFKKFK